jgi:hypothetical protein
MFLFALMLYNLSVKNQPAPKELRLTFFPRFDILFINKYYNFFLEGGPYGTTPISNRGKPSFAPYHPLPLFKQGNFSAGACL